MRLSGMGISRSSLFNICIFVVVACCLCMMHANFPTAEAISRVGGNETDRLALLEFKAKITNDPLQVMRSWNGSTHFCQWHGVTCGRRHKKVTMLDLESQKLSGSISPHIGNLSFLRELNLQHNSFELELPPQLGRLGRVQVLALSNNSISGNIPANLSACSNLLGFYLGNNNLGGTIPAELGFLSNLRKFSIWDNNLTGDIPHSLMNLSSLELLDAPRNNFGGSVPNALGQLTNLTFISLASNSLSGTIPPSIFNLSLLKILSVRDNQITGSLPSDIGITLPNLERLMLGHNKFTGSFPISIANASNLRFLQIAANKLSGKMPTMERLNKLSILNVAGNQLGSRGTDDSNFLSSLSNATYLRFLVIQNNNFGGMLPKSISNFSTKLETFSVADNHISGRIPAGFENLIKLGTLKMWGNQFTGSIPSDIGNLVNLYRLDLRRNYFSGYIPLSLGNLSRITHLFLGNNNLHGSIPSNIGKCQNLLQLDVSNNNLSGAIPPQVFEIFPICLDLSQNHFTGSLPVEIGNLKILGGLDVSNNMLSGEIPSTLGSCVRLEILHIGSNSFHGSIPSSLTFLRGLEVLDLSSNNLIGEIPEYFQGFQMLQKLNLSYNHFEGMVPVKGVFGNASAILIMGNNSKLCGGIPELELPKCNHMDPKRRGSTLSFKIVVPTASGLLVVTLVLCALCVCWCRKKREKPSAGDSGSLFLGVSYQSLHRATNGFSESNLIGFGSFGSVYEGILDQDGKKIAVKVLNLLHQGASKSFIAECEAWRNVRHRNLVKVLTACSGVDYQNNDFKALVYEFMVNGSLDDWLHPIGGQHQYEVPKKLSLVQRLNIAIDVACALNYLHHHCQTLIVHCDLKPNNVLLDDDMTAHIGDFGISRFLLDANYNDSENQTSSIGIRGSIGYTPPEYGMGSGVSTSGDVYSYGILLLEMFTGKRPTDDMFNEGLNLHNYVKMALPKRVIGIADPIILQQQKEGETSTSTSVTRNQSHVSSHKIQECLTLICRVGIACSTQSLNERLDISDVVAKLHVVRDNFLGTHGGRRIATVAQS